MHRLTTLPLAALALCTTAALAQEDRQDTRLPPVAWEQSFIGIYAPPGQCDSAQGQWVLTEFSVAMEAVICNGLGKMTWDEAGLMVPLTACLDGAQEAPPRMMTFAETPQGLRATAPDGVTTQLQVCPSSPD